MRRVLIVDDIPDERAIVRSIVSTEGLAFDEAGDGCQALAAIEASRPDCIVTDLSMPELDGFELLKELLDSSASIPTIVVTSDRQPSTRALCVRLGALDVLHKPYEREALRELLRLALNGCAKTAN